MREPVDIIELATIRGLNYEKLQKTGAEQDEVGADKTVAIEARRNIGVLRSIGRYLQTTRSNMRIPGNRAHFALQRPPRSLPAIGEKRCEASFRSGHRLARNYTRVAGPALYSCPIPGFGGATINGASVARSTPAHFRASRRNLDVIFAIRLELQIG